MPFRYNITLWDSRIGTNGRLMESHRVLNEADALELIGNLLAAGLPGGWRIEINELMPAQ